jgi:hypothetical protein
VLGVIVGGVAGSQAVGIWQRGAIFDFIGLRVLRGGPEYVA